MWLMLVLFFFGLGVLILFLRYLRSFLRKPGDVCRHYSVLNGRCQGCGVRIIAGKPEFGIREGSVTQGKRQSWPSPEFKSKVRCENCRYCEVSSGPPESEELLKITIGYCHFHNGFYHSSEDAEAVMVGDIVWFWYGDDKAIREFAPAIVTFVASDGIVNVQVFNDDRIGVSFYTMIPHITKKVGQRHWTRPIKGYSLILKKIGKAN